MKKKTLFSFCALLLCLSHPVNAETPVPTEQNSVTSNTVPDPKVDNTTLGSALHPTSATVHKHWCERHPERCEAMREERKQRQAAWCKKHPKKCSSEEKKQGQQS